ncbi:MAG: hypothetical protein CVV64_15715 [Candidatus Wallbacteria bacterium HGW-Wallbacteria-1]|jgi:hypothetical protein|uniref:Putative Se/S carrier protein-like domain-containing protein n=1 Tax=Candidatus Wallbacteria bacterium HGW-Wallbacteria-1 TaxID=2013854 RepID=A0A2N1PLJ8_9BACT|nr:MAG: hypothetical protein CVV64_15715 [Candidatus Wallbacteria bacterium HGW-Wallbacteria-1]
MNEVSVLNEVTVMNDSFGTNGKMRIRLVEGKLLFRNGGFGGIGNPNPPERVALCSEIGDIVITFSSTHRAIRGEKKLIASGLKPSIIATPRQISSECGFSILHKSMDLEILKEILSSADFKWDVLYRTELHQGERVYEKIS